MWGKRISEYLMICGILVSQWSVILNHFAFFAISEPVAKREHCEREKLLSLGQLIFLSAIATRSLVNALA
jgi:hypothetical protein